MTENTLRLERADGVWQLAGPNAVRVRVGVGGPDAALTEGLPDGVQHASGVRTAEEPTVRMRPLALWTVVVSRWPTLGDHLPRERRALCARQFRELRHLFLLPSISYFR